MVAWPAAALPLRSAAAVTGAAAPVTPAATDPVPLVSERVEGYTLGRTTNKAFWYATAGCTPSLDPISDFAETISRIALTGSEGRRLFLHEVNPTCNQQNRLLRPTSNLVADTNWVYFAQAGKLSRVSVFSKTADSTSITTFGSADPSGNAGLAQDADELFMISSASLRTSYIWRIQKTDGSFTRAEVNSTFSRDFTSDGENLYWLAGTSLRVYSLAAIREPFGTLDTGVNSYYAEGARQLCRLCATTRYVFIAKGNLVYRRDNVTGTTTPSPIYSGPVRSEIFDITSDGQHLFLWQAQIVTCEPLCSYNATLVRTNRTTDTSPEILYAFGTGLSIPTIDTQTRNGYLYWNWNGIQTLPVDASTLALTNMEITAVEVVQSMQDLLNTVPLIQKKRTFVRLHVKSNGPAVPGVGARLLRVNSNGDPLGQPLTPVNQTGTTLTVRPAPNRASIDDAFLFELPWSWTTGALRLRAELNPYKIPLQQDYAGNTRTINTSFKVSPRLEVQFVAFTYTLNKTTYAPRYIEDITQTYSWIRRAYPLASTIGSNGDSSPGFRPGLSFVTDADLGGYVDQSNTDCVTWYPDADLRNLCASNYTNIEMAQLRSDNGDPDSLFYYGMISDAAGIFPRGQAATNKVSSGPVGIPGAGNWDTDNAYGDWYAGHEIGHTLGRDHPGAASDDDTTKAIEGCGHSRTDLNYPYTNALISPPAEPVNGARFFGFDAGDAARGIPRAVLPGTQWADLMSYCAWQWISDYTYKGMYDFMLANPSLAATTNQTGATGDLLSVFGSISPATGSAVIPRLRRQTSVNIVPTRRPGPWSIQLLNGARVVADYPFTPAAAQDGEQPMLQVGQVVDFVPGTTTVRIVKLDTGNVYWSQAISAAAPAISGVSIRAASPITGNAGLSWTGSDADGDPLTFDILYSRNGGPFEPYLLNYNGSSLSVDTSRLGGGAARFRVIASDGAQTAQGDSAAVTMAAKPPSRASIHQPTTR